LVQSLVLNYNEVLGDNKDITYKTADTQDHDIVDAVLYQRYDPHRDTTAAAQRTRAELAPRGFSVAAPSV